MQRYFLLSLLIILAAKLSAQEEEIEAIKSQANSFSNFYMNQNIEGMLTIYASDAKIFPDKKEILSGQELINYWPQKPELSGRQATIN